MTTPLATWLILELTTRIGTLVELNKKANDVIATVGDEATAFQTEATRKFSANENNRIEAISCTQELPIACVLLKNKINGALYEFCPRRVEE